MNLMAQIFNQTPQSNLKPINGILLSNLMAPIFGQNNFPIDKSRANKIQPPFQFENYDISHEYLYAP